MSNCHKYYRLALVFYFASRGFCRVGALRALNRWSLYDTSVKVGTQIGTQITTQNAINTMIVL